MSHHKYSDSFSLSNILKTEVFFFQHLNRRG